MKLREFAIAAAGVALAALYIGTGFGVDSRPWSERLPIVGGLVQDWHLFVDSLPGPDTRLRESSAPARSGLRLAIVGDSIVRLMKENAPEMPTPLRFATYMADGVWTPTAALIADRGTTDQIAERIRLVPSGHDARHH
jgi:hypothetical protein